MKSVYVNPQTGVSDLFGAQILMASNPITPAPAGNVEDKHPVHHIKGQ